MIIDLQLYERSSDSRGTVSYDIQTNITGCFFQFLIGDGSRTLSGTLLCSFLDGRLHHSKNVWALIYLNILTGDQSTDHYTVCSQG